MLASESDNSYMSVNSNYEARDLTGPKDSTCDDVANTLLNNEKSRFEMQLTLDIKSPHRTIKGKVTVAS